MNEQIIIILSTLLSLAVGFAVRYKRNNSVADYTMNRNKLSWFPVAAGVSMTFAGGAALINMASLGFTFGWWTLVDPLALIGGIIISLFLLRKYRSDKGLTISDLLAGSDKKLSLLIGIISSTIFLLIIAAQFVAFSKLLAPYFPGINPVVLVIIPAILIVIYTYLGGFTAITNTDILQLILIGLFLLLPVLYYKIKIEDTTIAVQQFQGFQKMPFSLVVLLCVSVFFIPISQDINIRAKSAKSDSHAFKGLIFGAIFYSLIVIASSYIGISLARTEPALADPENAFSYFFKNNLKPFGLLAILAALAAIISTLDTYILNATTAISQDLLKRNKAFQKKSEKSTLFIAGIIVFVIGMSLALFFHQALTLILTALLIYISTLIPIGFGKYLGVNDKALFWLSLIVIAFIVTIEVFKINIEPKAIIYPASSVGLILLYYLSTKKAIIK